LEITFDTAHDRVDIEQLAELLRSVGWHDRASDPDRVHAAVHGSRWIVSAWAGPQLVGFCRAFSDGAFTAYVAWVVVHPNHQRRGIGRELIRRLMEGRERVAFVLHARGEVQPFYWKLGYADAPDMLRRARSS
jgi:ribosomal protein S18 acetylase RimI-like enzyme